VGSLAWRARPPAPPTFTTPTGAGAVPAERRSAGTAPTLPARSPA